MIEQSVCQQPCLQAMIRASDIAEDKSLITFLTENIYAGTVPLHDSANYIGCHAVGNSLHLRMRLLIIFIQRSGQYGAPLTAKRFKKIFVVIEHGFSLCVCE